MKLEDESLECNRQVLRRHCKDLHDRSEGIWFGSSRFSNLTGYLFFLRVLQNAHVQYGLPAAQVIGEKSHIEVERRRLKALERDLHSKAKPAGEKVDISPDFAWGIGYVLNGSALGASTLLKSHAISRSWPRRYLTDGYTFAREGDLARFFRKLNDQRLDIQEAVHGAEATFELFVSHQPERALA